MANTKISALPVASALAGTEIFPGVQSASTVQISLAQLLTYLNSVAGITVNAQTGTSYTVASSDRAKLITLSNAAAIAVTLPQATGSFGLGWYTWVRCLQNTGIVTITPTTSTIDALSTLVLRRGDAALIVSDGTNYQTIVTRLQGRGKVALTDAATVAIDCSLADNFYLLATSGVGATRALGAPTNMIDGQVINIRWVQDATGGRALTFNAKFHLIGSAVTLVTTANAVAFMSAQYDLTLDTWAYTINNVA